MFENMNCQVKLVNDETTSKVTKGPQPCAESYGYVNKDVGDDNGEVGVVGSSHGVASDLQDAIISLIWP